MPYIKQNWRKEIDDYIDEISCNIDIENPGVLNYVISKLIYKSLNKNGQVNYEKYNKVIGVIECSKLEIYRRLVSEYENEKIKENGDVFL